MKGGAGALRSEHDMIGQVSTWQVEDCVWPRLANHRPSITPRPRSSEQFDGSGESKPVCGAHEDMLAGLWGHASGYSCGILRQKHYLQ